MKRGFKKAAPKKKSAPKRTAKKAAAGKSERRSAFSKGFAAIATRDERETQRFLSAR